MRQIEWTTSFKRDFKRENRGQHKASLAIDLETVLLLLVPTSRCRSGTSTTRSAANGTTIGTATSSPT